MDAVDPRLPLYQRLRDRIAADIARNVWRPGEAIPTEAELAAVHKVAVGTVRKAVDVLVADGLVERSQGRGTFVRRPDFSHSLTRFLRHQGPNGERVVPESRILECTVGPGPSDVTDALGLAAAAAVIRLSRLRLIAGTPVVLDDIRLSAARFAPLLTLDPAGIGPLLYPVYESLCGESVASALETLTVGVADAAQAVPLGLAEGAPVVIITRLARGYDGHPVEWRRSCAPAATFRYQIDIR